MNAREFLMDTQAAIHETEGGRHRYVDAMWKWRRELEGIRNADRAALYRQRRETGVIPEFLLP